MQQIGPQLDELTHWLSECPPEFYQFLVGSGRKTPGDVTISVEAIVCDHLRDLNAPLTLIRQAGKAIARMPLAEKRLVAITVWLLREPWLMRQTRHAPEIGNFLTRGLTELARTINPVSTVVDSDRREELVRLCLRELGYRPVGETLEQAHDRLNTLDSVERVRVVLQTRAAEARARRIRESMAQKRAQEAAARYAPE